MVSLDLAAWAWPLCLAVGLLAWQAWPGEQRALAALSLLFAGLSAWALQPLMALVYAAAMLACALRSREGRDWAAALGLPIVFGALLRARLEWLPVLPAQMAFWAGLAALTGVCVAGQGVLASDTPQGLSLALLAGQASWACFGLVTGSPASPVAWVGLLGLLWQQGLLRQPLQAIMRRRSPPPIASALLFLGLGGCLGLSGFRAYFQLFTPLMGQSEGVADMHAKLFSGAGLLAAVCMLAVLVQTCAFGYFYWLRILPQAGVVEPEARPWPERAWPWVALGLSLAWGLQANSISRFALGALEALGLKIPFPSS